MRHVFLKTHFTEAKAQAGEKTFGKLIIFKSNILRILNCKVNPKTGLHSRQFVLDFNSGRNRSCM